jgi:uncharacterized delta-60 repeat protein
MKKISLSPLIIILFAFSFFPMLWNGCGAFAQSGSIDLSFNPIDTGFGGGDGASYYVHTCSIQSDGKIIIAGAFAYYNGIGRNGIARLNEDGTLDSSFDPGTGSNSNLSATAIQSDGKILIGGGFTSYNGTAINGIARLNSDGTLDTSFNSGLEFDGTVLTISVQSDGKIIIGGDFTSYSGIDRNNIARLNSNGTLDAGFNPGTGADSWVYTTLIQSGGKIIIGGVFNSYNGTIRNYIARLNSNGTLDTSFNPGIGPDNGVYSTAIQSDGKIIIGGMFLFVGGYSREYLARLNVNGTLDPSFNSVTGLNNHITTIAIQSDGKILIGGTFTSYNGITRNRIARANTNGTIDASFNPGTGANNTITDMSLQSDGNIIIVGDFTSYNGTGKNRVARINNVIITEISSPSPEDADILVFPNPASDCIFIEVSKESEISIVNELGSTVYQSKVFATRTSHNISSLSNGFYLVKISNDNHNVIKRLIIEK